MRLVNADGLRDILRGKYQGYYGAKPERIGKLIAYGIQKAIDCLNERPTIDAEPVKHAEWVGNNLDDVYFCSSCRHPEMYRLSAYCPECGAKMRRPWLDEKGEK